MIGEEPAGSPPLSILIASPAAGGGESPPPGFCGVGAPHQACSIAPTITPINAPCTRRLRHGDPMHAQERLTRVAPAAPLEREHLAPATARQWGELGERALGEKGVGSKGVGAKGVGSKSLSSRTSRTAAPRAAAPSPSCCSCPAGWSCPGRGRARRRCAAGGRPGRGAPAAALPYSIS
jgi:hypothetical protein